MKSVFIVTKPLQYINCTNIKRDHDNSVCCICDQFADSAKFFELCVQEGLFGSYRFFKTKEYGLLYWLFHQRQMNKLYLDSDFGLLTRFALLFFLGVQVFVYEEGYASYQPLRGNKTKKDKFLFAIQRLIRIKNFNGGSCKVSGVYLYNTKKYDLAFSGHNKDLLEFETPFYDAVEKSAVLKELCDGIDWKQFQSKSILVYLSSWSISSKAIEYCKEVDSIDLKILKLHPNIKSTPSDIIEDFDYILPSNIMFEYFYAKVRKIVKSITIVHHNSFAVEYIDEKDKANSVVI